MLKVLKFAVKLYYVVTGVTYHNRLNVRENPGITKQSQIN